MSEQTVNLLAEEGDLAEQDFYRRLLELTAPTTPPVPEQEDFWLAEWGHWHKSQGSVTFKKADVSALAVVYWQEAGRPEGRDIEFWARAEREVQIRAMAAAGVSGACHKEHNDAKTAALQQFCRRRIFSYLWLDPVDRTTQPPGTAYMFYCEHCGIHVETVPSDYMFPPRKSCSQCKGLIRCGWLKDAKVVAEASGYYLKHPRSYNEAGKQAGENPGRTLDGSSGSHPGGAGEST